MKPNLEQVLNNQLKIIDRLRDRNNQLLDVFNSGVELERVLNEGDAGDILCEARRHVEKLTELSEHIIGEDKI